jgi:type II secretory pathway component PulF
LNAGEDFPLSKSELGLSGGKVTLDQLIALNDEMAALVRAGVPLERGLIEAGRDLRGRLGEIATDLGTRMGQGERLPEAMARADRAMPQVYQAVVEAGVRSGRLAQALEGMASIARNYADARRAVGMAMLYPLIVLSLAYGLALFFILVIAPRFVMAFETLGLAPLRPLEFLSRIGDSAVYWAPIPPILLVLLAFRWIWTGQSVVLDEGALGPLFSRIPLIGSMIHNFRASNFATLLALLIEHRLPLADSVQLAGAASGDRSFRTSTEAFAQAIRSGDGATDVSRDSLNCFPPLLAWSLTTGRGQAELAPALRNLASSYRKKAESRALVLRSLLPTVLMLEIGAVAVVLYGLMLFIPLTTLWDELALPINQ